MTKFEMYLTADRIARDAHSGQTRRDGKTPYFRHVEDVMSRIRDKYGNAVFLRDMEEGEFHSLMAVAAAHDVLEDSSVTAEDLISYGLSQEIVDAVVAMTHRKGESYLDYLVRVRANPLAAKVKVADMLSNLADSPTDRQIVKYAKGLMFLVEGKSESP